MTQTSATAIALLGASGGAGGLLGWLARQISGATERAVYDRQFEEQLNFCVQRLGPLLTSAQGVVWNGGLEGWTHEKLLIAGSLAGCTFFSGLVLGAWLASSRRAEPLPRRHGSARRPSDGESEEDCVPLPW